MVGEEDYGVFERHDCSTSKDYVDGKLQSLAISASGRFHTRMCDMWGITMRLFPVVGHTHTHTSDEDSTSSISSGGFVRNSSSSVTSGNDSSDGDSSDNNSDAGAVSGDDSPQRERG
jgi:hypothetical protein